MKATLARADLARALDTIRPAIMARPTHPIIAAAVLDVADGTLTVSATNNDLTITRSIDADKSSDGRALVSGHKLRDLVSKFSAATVTLAVDNTVLRVTAGGASYRLALMPAGEYPAAPSRPAKVGEIPAGAVAAAMTSLRHASNADPKVASIIGVILEVDGPDLWFAATDRYRFALHPVPYRGDTFAARVDLASLLSARTIEGPADVHADDSLLAFVSPDTSITVRQLTGDGVPWRAIRDLPHEVPLTVDTATFAEALDRALLVTEQKASVRVDVADGVMTILAASTEDAEGAEEVEVTGDGETGMFINPRYLRELLACVDAPTVLLGARDKPTAPVVVRGLSEGEPTRPIHVLQPTRK